MTDYRTIVRSRHRPASGLGPHSGGFPHDSSCAAGWPAGRVQERDRADDGRRAHGLQQRRRARRRRADRRGRSGPRGPRRHRGDRRRGRHRDAGHDRHAPAHVADGDARLRRRLDPHPVLRLLLPGLGQDLPPAGRVRGQPAVGHRGDRRRRDHQRRLVARPADDRARRGGDRRARGGARPVRPRLRQHLPGRLGVGDHARVPRLLQPPVRRQGRHARLPDRLRPARRRRVPGKGRLRRRARPRRRGHHPRRASTT